MKVEKLTMANSELSVNTLLLHFPPCLRNNIKKVLTNADYGMSPLSIKINANVSKTSQDLIETYVDTFTLEIPFAGKHLEWEVIFQEEDHTFGPDFDFVNDLFLCDPDVNVISEHVPSLSKWDVSNPNCLISVIKELLKLYKHYQIIKLQADDKYSRLSEEYDLLLRGRDNSQDNIELYIDNSGSVHFVIGIIVDFSLLPTYMQPKANELLNPYRDLATLKLSFVKPDYTKVQSSLYLTPRLEKTMNTTKLRIPAYNKNTSLEEYVSCITALLKKRVEDIVRYHKNKIAFIEALVAQCGTGMIEYDNILFSRATLLVHINKIHAVVSICLGDHFPEDRPKVTLNSIYNLQNDKPFCSSVDSYPYSPRWKPDEMIRRILNYLQDAILEFQATAQRNFSI